MSLGLCLGGIETGALKNYVNADLSPRKILGILLCIDLDLLAVYYDGILLRLNGIRLRISALSRIIL